MKLYKALASLLVLVLLLSPLAIVASAAPLAAGGATRQIPAGGITSIGTGAPGTDNGIQQPELRPALDSFEEAGGVNRPRPGFKNGKFPK